MPIKQTIEIVWHPMTERPPRFARYLVAEPKSMASTKKRKSARITKKQTKHKQPHRSAKE